MEVIGSWLTVCTVCKRYNADILCKLTTQLIEQYAKTHPFLTISLATHNLIVITKRKPAAWVNDVMAPQ